MNACVSLLVSLFIACAPPDTGSKEPDRYHPDGWSDAAAHGMAAKLQEQVCTSCHGDDLAGGSVGESCDACHAAGWRTDCVFCHGGTDDTTGAPPRDVDNLDTDLSFPEHGAHVSRLDHPAWECEQCHAQPDDVLSPGHLFFDDLSAGVAEVSFGGGLSPVGTYAGNGSCTNLYCHGDGGANNGAVASGAALDCGSCHGTVGAPGTLSGAHPGHLDAGATCGECHADTATGNDVISGPDAHVDGDVDVVLPSGMTTDGVTCSGTCHDVAHDASDWASANYHPAGWDDEEVHGLAAKLLEQDCTSCHGSDLTGGTSGEGCDDCHEAGWRTDCTWCHGGGDNLTGAPPVDIDGASASLSFPEHTAHVEAQDHAAWGCAQCHVTPEDVLSEGHLFVADGTPGAAEVSFEGGLSGAGVYAGSAGCSNLYCHGDGGGGMGSVVSGAITDCGSCHGSAEAPGTLSDVHPAHLTAGASCGECHEATATGDDVISGPDEHVDAEVDVQLTSGMGLDGGTCTGTCHGVDHDASTWADGGFHPAGWDEPEGHGLAANLQTSTCSGCHGDDLAGGSSGAGCDSCHDAGWRTDCTWCHGGVDSASGAPPVDIDGATTAISFPEHTVHVDGGDHPVWSCDQCHTTPTDVLTDGHVFTGDTTPGAAELHFLDGLSPAATFSSGTCTNVYCHGDGAAVLGTVSVGATLDCAGCHGSVSNPETLSAVHGTHLGEGATCADCHEATTTGSDTISGPSEHVDGEVDVVLVAGMTRADGACTGACHGVDHDGSTWVDGGFHAAGWEEPEQHGPVASLQEQDCTACHGADLTGGTSGESCDRCHEADWRTNCTYCHGGTDNTTGAPPVDMDGGSTDISFPGHSTHVEAGDHVAWDCAQCHVRPTDILSDGHLFVGDTTPGEAELTFADGLSPDGTFSGTTCSNLYCHGNGAGGLGSVAVDAVTDCASCHGSADAPDPLSDVHAEHLGASATCGDCHAGTVSGDDTIVGAELHVDGEVDLGLPASVTWDGTTCTGTCHDVRHEGSTWVDGGFHPVGWEEADTHGLVANLLEQDCTDCHGADLTGGTSGEGCDGCHVADWRTTCTYCHGGDENVTGAPPVDIDGSSTDISFPEHGTHVEAGDHVAWGCEECHARPDDVLSAGHVYVGDSTPGQAEVRFEDGLSSAGSHVGATCANLYCHGDGAGTLGTVSSGATTDCASCHGSATAPGTLSTVHAEHLADGASCGDCHADTATGDDSITGPGEHVDGEVDVVLTAGITWDGTTCTGTCHATLHGESTWTEGGFHPVGWEEPDAHGLVAKLKEQDCTTCHGEALDGGTSGESCDGCHAADWRTDCTWCHGGTDNTTGAPPVDIDGSTTGLSFDEHTVHVEAGIHAAWDCDQCHLIPTDVLSEGHVFITDTTPGAAELDFSGGLSAAAVYGGSGTCSNLYCHGNGKGTLGSATTGSTAGCDTCHGSALSYTSLLGHHRDHLGPMVRAGCQECHATVVSSSSTIGDPTLHVNGSLQTSFPSGMVFSGTTCTGTCHGEIHTARRW